LTKESVYSIFNITPVIGVNYKFLIMSNLMKIVNTNNPVTSGQVFVAIFATASVVKEITSFSLLWRQ